MSIDILINVQYKLCMFVDVKVIDIENHNISEINNTMINNKDDFSYIDNDNSICDIRVFDDGIQINKKNSGYILNLCLRQNPYAFIETNEGKLKFDVKIVDFNKNNDILVMRYVLSEQEHEIQIRYRS